MDRNNYTKKYGNSIPRVTHKQSGNFILLMPTCIEIITTTTTPQPFYSPFSGTTPVSRCQKRTSGLYGAREG